MGHCTWCLWLYHWSWQTSLAMFCKVNLLASALLSKECNEDALLDATGPTFVWHKHNIQVMSVRLDFWCRAYSCSSYRQQNSSAASACCQQPQKSCTGTAMIFWQMSVDAVVLTLRRCLCFCRFRRLVWSQQLYVQAALWPLGAPPWWHHMLKPDWAVVHHCLHLHWVCLHDHW